MSGDKEEEPKTEQPQKVLKFGTFYAAITKYTQMFLPYQPDKVAPYEPDKFFAWLRSLLKEDEIYPTIDDKKWKLTYEFVKEMQEGPLTVTVDC